MEGVLWKFRRWLYMCDLRKHGFKGEKLLIGGVPARVLKC